MAILGASKFISFLALLLLLINSAMGAAAAQPTLKHGRKLLQTYDPGNWNWRKPQYYRDRGQGYRKARYHHGRGKYTQKP
ncbi:hypothetical protein VIGAN_02166100 [Vigna angularis var. angularis]|uniref:Uncharacterized protein n=1 Tax=Vigna angularis var. angularis TaxID=157739 RepID=A0A0S3RE54_PHAAN|nr:hypothetical protein VIGAN_02166100 [Vigna angularis var. angularis]